MQKLGPDVSVVKSNSCIFVHFQHMSDQNLYDSTCIFYIRMFWTYFLIGITMITVNTTAYALANIIVVCNIKLVLFNYQIAYRTFHR